MKTKNHNLLTGLLLCAILLSGAVGMTACEKETGTADETASTVDDTAAVAQTDEAMSAEDYALYSIADAEPTYKEYGTVFTLNHGDGTGSDVLYDEYRYYQLLYKNYFDEGDDTYWTSNPAMEERVKNLYLSEIIRNHAVLSECEKYGLSLTEEEKTEVDYSIAEIVMSFGGKDIFNEALVQYYMTPYYYNYQSQLEVLYSKLETYYKENGQILTEDSDIRAMLNTDEFIRCKHILVKNDTGENAEDNRALAEELLTRIQNGEDFDTLMDEYTEDTGLDSYPDGYYFFRGEMEENFEAASFALAENEMSGVVETTYGYHIILRLPKENTYMDENFDSIKEEYLSLRYYQVLDEVSADWTITEGEMYDTLSDWNFGMSLAVEESDTEE